jgi:hypothetical protein
VNYLSGLVILLISASWVARITGVSHQDPTLQGLLKKRLPGSGSLSSECPVYSITLSFLPEVPLWLKIFLRTRVSVTVLTTFFPTLVPSHPVAQPWTKPPPSSPVSQHSLSLPSLPTRTRVTRSDWEPGHLSWKTSQSLTPLLKYKKKQRTNKTKIQNPKGFVLTSNSQPGPSCATLLSMF